MKSPEDQAALMQSLHWWGVPTLFRCQHHENLDDCDIGLIGVPHSTGNGSTERDQHLAPRAVRDVSAIGRRVHMRFGFSPWERCRVRDLGDVPLPEGNNNEKSIQRITEFYRKIDEAGVNPVSIGGDHSITGGILRAISGERSKLCGAQKVALVQFDAHTDTYENLDHYLGAKDSAAHWASYLVHEGHVDPAKSVQVGIRGNVRTLDWLQTSRDLGYEVITMERYNEVGAQSVVETINERIGEGPVYVTFDLDCLDPSVAPGVANLEAGANGFMVDQAVQLLQSLRGKQVIGGDVVCLVPTKDQPNQITSLVAMSIMFELICLIADREQSHRLNL